jgi:ribosomal protein S18 acetylase RimI-like enzyme
MNGNHSVNDRLSDLGMDEAERGPEDRPPMTIRPAVPEDADAIARTFLESADHHARLDPERYAIPDAPTIAARYRAGQQHLPGVTATTLVVVIDNHVVGFVDVRLDRSPDPMHRDITYCHVVEIAISPSCQSQGVGATLLQAAEDWGRRNGATFASLEYLAANTRAGDFYQRRMGYRVAALTAIKRL